MLSEHGLQHPRVTRDTRRLLVAACVALAVLWLLARLRFPDTRVTANPVPPLLAQLAPPPSLSSLAAEVAAAAGRLPGSFSPVSLFAGDDGRADRAALRVRPGIAAAIVPAAGAVPLPIAVKAVAADRATGLVVVPVREPGTPAVPRTWAPERLTDPQFLLATTMNGSGELSLAPVFIASFSEQPSATWGAVTWQLPVGSDAPAGAFLLTSDGELAGVVIDEDGRRAVVPADTLLARIDALLAGSAPPADGWLGLSVAPLTPSLARATGVIRGVVVTDTDPDSPAAATARAGDVITAANGSPIDNIGAWHAISARLRAGDSVDLRIAGAGVTRDVRLVAAPLPAAGLAVLGAQLQRDAAGARVLAVASGSAADAAGLMAGDVVTRVGDLFRPTPRQIARAYAGLGANGAMLVAFTRGTAARVTALER